jgi:hypothetical protein
MAEGNDTGGGKASRVQIVVAVIGLVGTLGVAILANWDKIAGGGSSHRAFYLNEHQNSLITKENIYEDLQWGRVYWQDRVFIDGTEYPHALGMHADNGRGFADFKIPDGAKYFQTVFGLARDDKAPNPEHYGNAIGRIAFDGVQVWERHVSGPTAVRAGPLEIPHKAKVLRLEVDSVGSNWGDHTTWGDPFFSWENAN